MKLSFFNNNRILLIIVKNRILGLYYLDEIRFREIYNEKSCWEGMS